MNGIFQKNVSEVLCLQQVMFTPTQIMDQKEQPTFYSLPKAKTQIECVLYHVFFAWKGS